MLALALGGCTNWESALVSVSGAGTGAGNGASSGAVISPDGTKVAFVSKASDLVPVDGNGVQDVFVRDLATGVTTLVSANGTGSDSGNGESSEPSFSPDGTRILFVSRANDLGPTDTNAADVRDVYISDLSTGTTTLVSHDAAGTGSGNGESYDARFSPDGTEVAFVSSANNFGPIDTSPTMMVTDIYVRDLETDGISLVTTNMAGTDAGPWGLAQDPAFSPDGTKLVFVRSGSGLEPIETTGGASVYVRDLATATTTLVSINAAGTNGVNRGSFDPVFSPDGTKVAFVSAANDLGPTDTVTCYSGGYFSGCSDVYLRDLVAGSTTLVSVNGAGTDAGNGPSGSSLGFSPDGTKIVFTSTASDLGPTDTNTCPIVASANTECEDVYVRDLVHGTTTLVSVDASGEDAGTGRSRAGAFTPDGLKVIFTSRAGDLGPADTNGVDDVYIRHLVVDATKLVSANADDSGSGNAASGPDVAIAAEGDQVAFTSMASDLGGADANNLSDVYLAVPRPLDP
jgi:Tol biopolymer transport system component